MFVKSQFNYATNFATHACAGKSLQARRPADCKTARDGAGQQSGGCAEATGHRAAGGRAIKWARHRNPPREHPHAHVCTLPLSGTAKLLPRPGVRGGPARHEVCSIFIKQNINWNFCCIQNI